MKVLKQFIVAAVAACVLAVGALADGPQKNNDPKPPPPKENKQVPNPPKNPPPRDNGNKGGNDNKRGKP
jgi:hypothetical protein